MDRPTSGTRRVFNRLSPHSHRRSVILKLTFLFSVLFVVFYFTNDKRVNDEGCSSRQAAMQGQVFESAKVRGCPPSDDIWMRLVQKMIPHASVFIDIGSNKGYTGARFFALWRPELGMTSRIHAQTLRATSSMKELRECGACGDCQEDSKPLVDLHQRLCGIHSTDTADPSKRHAIERAAAKLCQTRREEFSSILVLSFDGNKYLVDGLRDAIDYNRGEGAKILERSVSNTYLQDSTPANPGNIIASTWITENRAFTASCAPDETLTFMLRGELGHISDDRDTSEKELKRQEKEGKLEAVKVPCLTVDQLVKSKSLEHIDILKIDTEGHDLSVLEGATQTLSDNKVSVILFEYNKFWPKDFDDGVPALRSVVENLEGYGFVCYLEGKNALVRLTRCWSEILAMRQWSNIYCVSSHHAAGLVAVFDSHSLAFTIAADDITIAADE